MSGAVLSITTENFSSEILEPGGPALIDFYATWCGPCKTIAPIVEELAEEYQTQGLKVGKVDIDESADIAAQYSITGVPTLVFFKGGEKVDQLVGAHPRSVIEDKVKTIL